jgi:hypothetical protein
MGKGEKDFPQVRMEGRPGTEGPERDAPPAAHTRDERTRAAAYLDLWERHLTQAAVSGPDPFAGRPPD